MSKGKKDGGGEDNSDHTPSLEEVSRRLRDARGNGNTGPDGQPPKGGVPSGRMLGIALRMSTEFVAAVVIGGAMGWGLDRWLGTEPWLLLVFFLLGAATGFRNVIRTANEMGAGRE